MFDKLICAISIICLPVVLVLVLVLKNSLRTYFKSLSWSLGVKFLSLFLGGQVQEVLVLVLWGQFLVLVLGVRSLLTSLGLISRKLGLFVVLWCCCFVVG